MNDLLQVEGRRTGIIDLSTNLDILSNVLYQNRNYDLFKVTISAFKGAKSADLEDGLALSCPDTASQPDFVGNILSARPDVALLLHFRPEDYQKDKSQSDLKGIILMTEIGKDKYSAFTISGYEGSLQKPKVLKMLTQDRIRISKSAKAAIASIPNQLR